jgi:hypothetical protein
MIDNGASIPDETDAFVAPPLPIFRTAAEGIAALRPAWTRLLGLVLLILVVEVGLELLSALIPGLPREALDDPTSAAAPGAGAILMRLLRVAIGVVLYINLLLVVARLVLFAEPPAMSSLFRWGRRQWRLLGVFVVTALVAAVPSIIGALFAPLLGSFLASPGAITAFLALYMLCWLWAGGWLSLVIPVIAGDDPAGAFDKAWHVADGNRLRLMGLVACIVVVILVAIGSAQIFEAYFTVNPLQAGIVGYALAILLIEIVYIAYAAVGTAAYRRLTGRIADRDDSEEA